MVLSVAKATLVSNALLWGLLSGVDLYGRSNAGVIEHVLQSDLNEVDIAVTKDPCEADSAIGADSFLSRFKLIQRQTLVEWAGLTIPRSYWAEQFYRQHRARGAGHQAALRALAFKWVRILLRCWQTGERYDETRYLKTLLHRSSPVMLAPEKPATQP